MHPLTRWPLRHDWHAHLVPSGRTTILGLRDYVQAACLRDLRDLQTERLGGAASLEIEGCGKYVLVLVEYIVQIMK